MDGVPAKDDYNGGLALFIIDPQVDFHEGGSLAVSGAIQDSKKIIKLLKNFRDHIERIVVTLDTHHSMHIHTGPFWQDANGKQPEPFTTIVAKDVKDGKWTAREPVMQDWARQYAEQLEEGGRFQILIWPPHCILGTPGHAVHAPLMEALTEWAISRKRSINWLFKGQNNRTEMYSALKAEVPVPSDPTTAINTSVVNTFTRHAKVVCCGEAMSHCVNHSVRDLVSKWPASRVSDIVLLSDAASAVPSFEDAAQRFLTDMQAAGVTVTTTDSFEPMPMSDIPKTVQGSASDFPTMGAAGLMNGCVASEDTSGGVAVFLIDPQVDFHEG